MIPGWASAAALVEMSSGSCLLGLMPVEGDRAGHLGDLDNAFPDRARSHGRSPQSRQCANAGEEQADDDDGSRSRDGSRNYAVPGKAQPNAEPRFSYSPGAQRRPLPTPHARAVLLSRWTTPACSSRQFSATTTRGRSTVPRRCQSGDAESNVTFDRVAFCQINGFRNIGGPICLEGLHDVTRGLPLSRALMPSAMFPAERSTK